MLARSGVIGVGDVAGKDSTSIGHTAILRFLAFR